MSNIIKPGQHILYMKVGTHAREDLAEIIARKTKEIEETGFGFWGYGGNTCHPQTMVQPFARETERNGQRIYLVMEPMQSKHFAEPLRADDYSVNGTDWRSIPESINVLGSRYALVINNLHETEFVLPLANTRVALGNSKGAKGSNYVSGRVDKACLEIVESAEAENEVNKSIGLVAEIVEPYAVYVRNRAS